MAAIKIQVESRPEIGKNKVDKIRQNNFIPGVLYGKGEGATHIKVDTREFEKVYREAGTSTLIDLMLDGKTSPALIKEVQTHPYKNQYLHVDFQLLDMDEKVRLTVPINLIGRENITHQPSILIQQLDEIEIECLPAHIPDSIDVDVSNIDFATPIFISDLEIYKNEDITILRDPEDVIASLVEPTMEEEIEEAEDGELEVDAEDVPVVGEDEEEEE